MTASPANIPASRLRLAHSPRPFGATALLFSSPVAPGSHSRPFAGAMPAAADILFDRLESAAAFCSFGRSGRPGRAAAYLADRAPSAPSCLRVAPGEGAGDVSGASV